MKKKEAKFPRIDVPSDGRKGVNGGAFCTVWFYGEAGNLFLTGYIREVTEYLKNLNVRGFAKYSLHCKRNSEYYKHIKSEKRVIYRTFNVHFDIYYSRIKARNCFYSKPYTIYLRDSVKIELKRLPNRFVDFDKKECRAKTYDYKGQDDIDRDLDRMFDGK